MQASGGLVIFLAWLAPNHYPPWNSFHSESLSALGLLLLAAGGLAKQRILSPPPAAWAIVAIAMIPGLQWATGQLDFSGDAWISSLYLLGLAVAVCVGFNAATANAHEFAALLATVALAGAIVSSAIATAQCAGVQGSVWIADVSAGGRGIGNLAQPNNLATLIGLGTTGLWLLFEQRRLRPVLASAAIAILLLGVTLTQSRTALLFGPALLALRAAMYRRKIEWRLRTRSVAILLAAQWLMAIGWPVARRALLLDAPDSLSEITLQTGRLLVWPVLVDGALQNPWFGYGWLQTGAAQLAAATRHPQVDELFLQSHNVFLDLVIWSGVPVGLLLSSMLVGWFVSRVRGMGDRESTIGLIGVSLFGIHALLELPHHYAYFLLPIGLWVGFIEAQRGTTGVGRRAATPWLAIGTAGLAIALICEYPAVEEDFRLMRFETLSIGPLSAEQPAPEAPLLSSLTAYLRVARTPITGGMGQQALNDMTVATRRYPYSLTLYRYAKALALNGQLPASLSTMDKMRHIHGELRYQAIRKSLHQEVLDGQIGLAALDKAMPR